MPSAVWFPETDHVPLKSEMIRSDFKFIFFYCTLEIWKFALHSMRAPPFLAYHGMTLKSFETILNIMHQEITFWPVSWGLRPLWNSMERDNEQQIVTPATKEKEI